jgi:RNA polymerase sigma-70 factor (ECF subfamily)
MTLFSGDGEAALDGVSHAFAKALANKTMLEAMPEPAMKAWLYAASRNAVVDIKRREKRLSRLAKANWTDALADPRPDDPLRRVMAELLIKTLPKSLRALVKLKYYLGMNAAEIGKAMNIPAATVRTRLRAALRRLREKH